MSQRLQIIRGDCLEVLKTLPTDSVQCCVTSPPYWGLRDMGPTIHSQTTGWQPTCLDKEQCDYNKTHRK